MTRYLFVALLAVGGLLLSSGGCISQSDLDAKQAELDKKSKDLKDAQDTARDLEDTLYKAEDDLSKAIQKMGAIRAAGKQEVLALQEQLKHVKAVRAKTHEKLESVGRQLKEARNAERNAKKALTEYRKFAKAEIKKLNQTVKGLETKIAALQDEIETLKKPAEKKPVRGKR